MTPIGAAYDGRHSDLKNRGLSLLEALQKVENALLQAGYDNITVVTEHGTFHWMTVERARARGQSDRNA